MNQPTKEETERQARWLADFNRAHGLRDEPTPEPAGPAGSLAVATGCMALGCRLPAVWKSETDSLHVKPRRVTTYWCAAHADILGLRRQKEGTEWKPYNTKFSGAPAAGRSL